MEIITNKIEDIGSTIDIDKEIEFNIIDLVNSTTTINLVLNVSSNCIINLASCTYENNKQIKVTINLMTSHIDVKLNVNSLTIGNTQTTIELYGTNTQKIKDTAIDMQVSGILSAPQGRMSCLPMYDFSTNTINATHGVTMGAIDEEQIFNLLVKGIAVNDAKTMIIWSKFNMALAGVDDRTKATYYQIILDKWHNNHEDVGKK